MKKLFLTLAMIGMFGVATPHANSGIERYRASSTSTSVVHQSLEAKHPFSAQESRQLFKSIEKKMILLEAVDDSFLKSIPGSHNEILHRILTPREIVFLNSSNFDKLQEKKYWIKTGGTRDGTIVHKKEAAHALLNQRVEEARMAQHKAQRQLIHLLNKHKQSLVDAKYTSEALHNGTLSKKNYSPAHKKALETSILHKEVAREVAGMAYEIIEDVKSVIPFTPEEMRFRGEPDYPSKAALEAEAKVRQAEKIAASREVHESVKQAEARGKQIRSAQRTKISLIIGAVAGVVAIGALMFSSKAVKADEFTVICGGDEMDIQTDVAFGVNGEVIPPEDHFVLTPEVHGVENTFFMLNAIQKARYDGGDAVLSELTNCDTPLAI